MNKDQKKAAEFKRLELQFDTFPLSQDAEKHPFRFRYTKMQPLESNRMNFYEKPDFVIEDIFYNVLNGRIVINNKK